MVVPGLGRNLFSVPQDTLQGATTTFAAEALRIEKVNFCLPLKQVAGARELYSFEMELNTPEPALQATRINTADNWHHRMGHINTQSIGLLNKTDTNRMYLVGGVSGCDICAGGKSTQREHPNKTNLNISNPFELVYTDRHLQRWEVRVCEQDHRQVHQVDRSIPHSDQTGSEDH